MISREVSEGPIRTITASRLKQSQQPLSHLFVVIEHCLIAAAGFAPLTFFTLLHFRWVVLVRDSGGVAGHPNNTEIDTPSQRQQQGSVESKLQSTADLG